MTAFRLVPLNGRPASVLKRTAALVWLRFTAVRQGPPEGHDDEQRHQSNSIHTCNSEGIFAKATTLSKIMQYVFVRLSASPLSLDIDPSPSRFTCQCFSFGCTCAYMACQMNQHSPQENIFYRPHDHSYTHWWREFRSLLQYADWLKVLWSQ